MTVAGAFVDVCLAKEGHHGVVGINVLEKIQMPTLSTLYGALLADVDYVGSAQLTGCRKAGSRWAAASPRPPRDHRPRRRSFSTTGPETVTRASTSPRWLPTPPIATSKGATQRTGRT